MKFSKVPVENVTSAAFHRSNSNNICNQNSHFATGISKVSTERQSIGIHDVHLFNIELAMHYRAIFNFGNFRLVSGRDFVAVFWSIFLVIKAKQDQSGSCFLINLLCE